MANTPLLANLTKGARTALPFFQALAGSDLTPTEIVRQAKAAGYSFRNQQGFDIIAALRDVQSSAQYLRSLAADAIPNPDKFAVSPNKILRNYSYRVLARGVNPDTGNTVNRIITVSTNEVLSKQQVIDKIPDVLLNTPGSDVMEFDTIEIQDVMKSAALG